MIHLFFTLTFHKCFSLPLLWVKVEHFSTHEQNLKDLNYETSILNCLLFPVFSSSEGLSLTRLILSASCFDYRASRTAFPGKLTTASLAMERDVWTAGAFLSSAGAGLNAVAARGLWCSSSTRRCLNLRWQAPDVLAQNVVSYLQLSRWQRAHLWFFVLFFFY